MIDVISAEESREHRIRELDELIVGHVVVFVHPPHRGTLYPMTVLRAPYQDRERSAALADVWWVDVQYPPEAHVPGPVVFSCGDAGVRPVPSHYNGTNFVVDLTVLRGRGIVIDGVALFDREAK